MRRLCSLLLFGFLGLSALIAGCGGQGSDLLVESRDGGSGSATPPPPAPPPAGTVVYGRFMVLPVLKFENVDPEVLQALEAVRSRLEARGMTLLEDALAWPISPASGWTIRVGQETLLCDETGAFSFTVPEGLTTFTVIHPSSAPDGGYMAPVEVAIGEFGSNQDEVVTMVIPMGFQGPCGMSPGDTDEICRALPEAPVQAQRAPRYTPPLWVPPTRPGQPTYGVLRGPLGTYPPELRFRTPDCPDTDGAASLFVSTSFASSLKRLVGRSGGEILTYVGSICDVNVLNGACLHENDLSDLEEDFARRLATALGFKVTQPGRRATNTGGTCFFNHKGRVCGMFLIGDVSLDLGDRIVKTGESATLEVLPGDVGTITVHNNGAFGLTNIQASRAGVISLESSSLKRLGPLTSQLKHFDGGSGPYQADRVLTYRVPDSAQPGDDVTFEMQVDDLKVTLTFEVGGVSITPGFTNLRAGQNQRFEVLLGGLSPNGLTYEWSLAEGTGTLSATTGRVVTYTPRDDLEEGIFLDTLRLRVLAPGPSGQRVERATATAQIRYTSSDVGITPMSARLIPGESQTFEVLTTQPPDEELSYEWTATGNFGTLSTNNRPTVTYLVRDDVQPPQTVELKATVYAGSGATRSKVGEATAIVDIVEPAGGERVLLRVIGADITQTTLLGYSLDLATGQLTPANTSLALTPRQIGFGTRDAVILSPTGARAYYARAEAGGSFSTGVDVIDIDDATGAFTVSAVAPLPSGWIEVSENSLCCLEFQVGGDANIVHYDLDAAGAPTPSGAVLASGEPLGFKVVTGPQGGEYVYSLNAGVLSGYRVQNGTATPVPGSPFPVFTPSAINQNRMGIHPEMTSLLVVQNNADSGGLLALHAVRIDPANGGFLGLGSTYSYPDTTFAFNVGPVAVAESGRVAFSKNNEFQIFQVSSGGALSFLTAFPTGGQLIPALDPSGQYLLDWTTPGDGSIIVQTYRLGPSSASLVDTDPVDRVSDIITRPRVN